MWFRNVLSKSTHQKEQDLLLTHPDFEAKTPNPSFKPSLPQCEASALTAELIAPNRSYFSPKNQLYKTGTLALGYKL